MDKMIKRCADASAASELLLERYTPSMKGEWDTFVSHSRNGTFLFSRDYMDYHSDRFVDHSLVARRKGTVFALLPASEHLTEEGKRILRSHGGLTYGGWVLSERHRDESDMLSLFRLLRDHAAANGIDALDYKPVPHIYAASPSDDDRYALFRQGARLTECNISACINLAHNPGFNTQQTRNLKRALNSGVEIVTDASTDRFHALLTSCLAERHGVKPVHTAEELELLRSRFPQNIRHFMVTDTAGKDLAGICVFDCGRTVHAQYICSNAEGRAVGALTALFHYLINTQYVAHEYFDFGICNEDAGTWLNAGLYRQKAGLGGSGVAYERYLLEYGK